MTTHLMIALWRAEIYRLLAIALDQPKPELISTLRDVIQGVVSDANTCNAGHGFMTWLAECDAQLSGVPFEEWLTEYNRMFVNEVFVPPSEGSYCISERGTLVGDISGFYKAFCMQVTDHAGPPDQIKIELGFMCMLALKEVNAVHTLPDKVEVTRAAAKSFFEDHLGRWAPQFADRLHLCSSLPLYRAISNILLAWFKIECEYWGSMPTPYPKHLSATEGGSVECPFSSQCS